MSKKARYMESALFLLPEFSIKIIGVQGVLKNEKVMGKKKPD